MLVATPMDEIESAGPLLALRRLRATQAGILACVSVVSIIAGIALIATAARSGHAAFAGAVGWQFVIWAAIDLVFAALGIAQSVKVARIPPTPQAEADEFLLAEKLLKSLRFNHKLNVVWLLTAAALLAWAYFEWNEGLAGHGVGVGIQGGFLFVFDLYFAARLGRLMTAPVI